MSLSIRTYETSPTFLTICPNLFLQECGIQIRISASALPCQELGGINARIQYFLSMRLSKALWFSALRFFEFYLPQNVVWSFLNLLIKWLLSWLGWFTNFYYFSVTEHAACLHFTGDCLVIATSLIWSQLSHNLLTIFSDAGLSSY